MKDRPRSGPRRQAQTPRAWRTTFRAGWQLAIPGLVLIVWLPFSLFWPRDSLATVTAATETVRLVIGEPTEFSVDHIRVAIDSEPSFQLDRARLGLEAGVAISAERIGTDVLTLMFRNQDAPGQPVGSVATDSSTRRALPDGTVVTCWSAYAPEGAVLRPSGHNIVIAFSGAADIGDEVAPKSNAILLRGKIDIHERSAFPFQDGRFLLATEELDGGDRVSLGWPAKDRDTPVRGFIYAGPEEAIRVTAHGANSQAQVVRYGSAGRPVRASPLARMVNDPVFAGITSALVLCQAVLAAFGAVLQRESVGS